MGLRIDDEPVSSTSSPQPGSKVRRGSMTRTVLDNLEMEAVQQRKSDEKLARQRWLIMPNSMFLKCWLAVIGPLIVYNVIWVPLEVSQMAVVHKTHGRIDFILDFFFYIDIVINFRTAHITKENELCLEWRAIARRYLHGSFIIDFIATVQWETFITGQTAFSDMDKGSNMGAAFGILRLPRLLRLVRLFKKLDMFPQLKVIKLIFMFVMVAHWVGCLWFFVGWLSIANHKLGGTEEAVSEHGALRGLPEFTDYATAEDGSFGDSWLLRHFGPKHLHGLWDSDPTQSVASIAKGENRTIEGFVEVSQLYFTSLYWSFTMLMKSPHIGPDTWIEKLFGCLMVLLGLGVTTQLVAVITQMVMSFDKANSAFRDRQNDNMRFATSRSLPAALRRKLLTYSLQDWSVNLGYDPYEVIKAHRLPPALSNSILAAIYDDVIPESPLLRLMETPVLHELLRFVKVAVSLQKETLINQNDPCTRLYILRAGSLQASATDKLIAQTTSATASANPAARTSQKMGRQTTWKQKMQVRMIERPGEVICSASPFAPPQPLPFQLMSLKRSTLLSIHMQDLLGVMDMTSHAQADAVCTAIARAHRDILLSVMPKSKDAMSMRESKPDPRQSGYSPDHRNSSTMPGIDEAHVPTTQQGMSERRRSSGTFDSEDLGTMRLDALDADIDRCLTSMAALHEQTKAIPRMVQALSAMHGKPMQAMGPAATAALKSGGAGAPRAAVSSSTPREEDLDALAKEVGAAK